TLQGRAQQGRLWILLKTAAAVRSPSAEATAASAPPPSRRDAGAVEGHRQRLRSAEDAALEEAHLARGATQVAEARKQLLEGNAALESCERRAEAVVDAEAEGHVLLRIAAQLESVSVRVLARVAVRGREQHHQVLALVDLGSRDLRIARGHARQHLDRRYVAERLLDEARNEGRVALDGREVLRAVEQQVDRVPDQVRGRLVSRYEHQDQEEDQLVEAEPAVLLVLDEHAEEVVGGL